MDVIERRFRGTAVLHGDDVVDDETLHPGAVVWLCEPPLCPDERARFDAAGARAALSARSGDPDVRAREAGP